MIEIHRFIPHSFNKLSTRTCVQCG